MSMLSRFPTTATAGIQYVGGTTAQITGSTATTTNVSLTGLTGGMASAAAANDLVIVYYGVGSTVARTLTVTTGYTSVASLTVSDTFDANLVVAYKVMGLTPDTTVTVSATGATADSGAVALQVWRYVDPYIPLDVTRTTATAASTVLCNPPSITPTSAGAVVIAGGAGAHSQGVATYSSSDLRNFITVGGPNNTNDVTVGMGSRGVSGTFDPAAFTFSGSNNAQFSNCSVTLALRPSQNQPGPFAISTARNQAIISSTSLIIGKPPGTRENDLIVAAMFNSVACTWTGDAGWTEVADQGAAPSLRIAYKVAGASEGATYTFTASAAGTGAGLIATYRNAAYDAIGAITTGADPLVVGAVTASVSYARILAAVGRNAANITITGPASMQLVQIENDATYAPSSLMEQDIALSNSGSSGTRSFTVGSTTEVAGALIALKPAASYSPYAVYITDTINNSTTGSITVDTPVSVIAPGGLLLFVVTVAISTATDVTVSTPSGWTLLSGNSTSTTAFQPGIYVFYREVDGTESATYTATASTTCGIVGSIIAVGGTNNNEIIAGTTNTGSGSLNITATSVNAFGKGILFYIGAQANDNQGLISFTPPSGMTEIIDTGSNGAAVDLKLGVSYQEDIDTGGTGNKTATASASLGTNRYRAILVAVGPK